MYNLQKILLGNLVAAFASTVFASGYNVGGQSISVMSTADASAAEAADAGTIFYNPAGLSYLNNMQISGNVLLARPNARYYDAQASYPAYAGGDPVSGNSSGKIADQWKMIPHAYFAYPINENITAGLGIYVPFGTSTEYDHQSVNRYAINRTELQTLAINPSIAFKIHSQHSIGIGLIAQHADAKLRKYANFSPALSRASGSRIPNGLADGFAEIDADDWGFGFNLGWMWDVNEQTRLGLSYRSSIKHTLKGQANWSLEGPAFANPFAVAGVRANGYAAEEGVSGKIATPESISLHGMYQANPQLDLFANVTWTRHSRFNELDITFENKKTVVGGETEISRISPHWKDTWRIGLGGSYQISEPLQLRAGIAWDQAPIRDVEHRLVTMPDNDRFWLSLGAKYDLNDKSSINLGYSYVTVKDSEAKFSGCSINPCVDSGVIGSSKFKADSHFIGLQYTHRFE